jgi:23S rRNA-/tRNA-specific pseudouridylate synthase
MSAVTVCRRLSSNKKALLKNTLRMERTRAVTEKSPRRTEITDDSILHLDGDYCVINKPANLRMDGPSENTVEKQLQSWFASQDKVELPTFSCDENSNSSSISSIIGKQIPPLKWIHQLDYATSGVLCVGLNRVAAAKACSSFEHRETSKEYIAVVEGHVDLKKWPLLSCKQVKPLIGPAQASSDKVPARKRTADHTDNVPPQLGSNPALTDIQQLPQEIDHHTEPQSDWQNVVMIHNLKKCFDVLTVLIGYYNSSREELHEGSDYYDAFQKLLLQEVTVRTLNTLQVHSFEKFKNSPKLRKSLRKFLKALDIDTEQAASTHTTSVVTGTHPRPDNAATGLGNEAQKQMTYSVEESNLSSIFDISHAYVDHSSSSPLIYRYEVKDSLSASNNTTGNTTDTITTNNTNSNSGGSGSSDRLVINVPIADVPGEFRMQPGSSASSGSEAIVGRHSETEVQVLCRGYSACSREGQPQRKQQYHW